MKNVEDFLPGKFRRPLENHPDLGRIALLERDGVKFLTVDGDVCFQLLSVCFHDDFLEIVGLEPQPNNRISENLTYLGPGSVAERIAKIEQILTGFNLKYLIRRA